VLELSETHDLCVAGDGLGMLQRTSALQLVVPLTKVFARVAPDQKELILTTLKAAGRTTLMCGDGTNDVGALKQAHAGVALLNAIPPTAQGETLPSSESSTKTLTPSTSSTASTSPGSYNMFYDPISELQFSEIIRLYCAICDTYFGRKL
jgi:cation-transporting ATPase 13A1